MAMTHEKENHDPSLEFGGPFGPGPRETVADLLRRARQDFGQNLRTVADVLRIRPAYLEALESGEFSQLPGTAYAIGFLRTYADYLGLDAENMVERFKAETRAAAHRTELIFPEPAAEGRIPGGAIILVSMALLAVAYGSWFYLSQQGRTVADLIPAWPTETQTAKSGEADSPAKPAPEVASDPVEQPAEDAAFVTTASAQASPTNAAEVENAAPVAAVPETPVPETPALVAPPSSQESAVTEVEPVTEPPAQDDLARAVGSTAEPTALAVTASAEPHVAVSPAPLTPSLVSAPEDTATPPPIVESQALADETSSEPATLASLVERTVVIPAPPSTPETVIIPDDRSPRVYGGSNDESRIVIRALQDSWVQVRDAQEAILLTRVLRAGDSYRVPNVTGLTLLTGNAGGIELEVDGIRLPPAGPPGSVRRSISLNPAQLLSNTANNR